MFIIGFVDLASLGTGTCGAIAEKLIVNCWGVRLLRSITNWPTNVASAVIPFAYGAMAVFPAFVFGPAGD
jgi:hypothetical protein